MTQVLEGKPVTKSNRADFPDDVVTNEFNYQPVPIIAVCGFVLALLSILSVVVWIAIPIALLACLVSAAAFFVIVSSKGAYGGTWLAVVGVVLPIACATAGTAYQVYTYKNELPPGYERVSFYQDISKKGFTEEMGSMKVPAEVQELQGKKIFMKGYIYPTEKMKGLTKFLLLKDNQQCCFGGKPALEDRMIVELEGMTFDHTYNKVSVAGVFEINPNYEGDQLDSVYTLKAHSCTLSASDF